MVFNHFEFFRIITAHGGVIFPVPQGIGRRGSHGEGELGAATGVQRIVNGTALQQQFKIEVVAFPVTIFHEVVPVLHVVQSIVEGCHELEIVVRPVQTFAVTDGSSQHGNVFIRVVG
ncbi:hypothetical protein Barb6_00050 [Bacteroidales bacterium Barb6]|nr:hypothetical protein Barb6_00050 [Bacteroidales bacterium Barb6]